VIDDFVSGAKKRCLKQNAVPSIFPWNQRQILKCLSLTSKKALQPLTSDKQDSLHDFDADLNAKGVELQCISDNSEHMDNSSCTTDLQMGSVELKLANLECMLSTTQNKLAETESKLADTENKLAPAECRLADSESKLADTERKLADTECKLADAEIALADSEKKLKRSLFRLENIKYDDNLIKLYAGFNDHDILVAFLQSDAKVMRQWSGRRSGCNYDDVKVGPTFKLPLEEQLFMTLVRLLEQDIAYRFNISQASVSRITST